MRYYFRHINDTAQGIDIVANILNDLIDDTGIKQDDLRFSKSVGTATDVAAVENGEYMVQGYTINGTRYMALYLKRLNKTLRAFGARAAGRHIITIKLDDMTCIKNKTYTWDKINQVMNSI